MQLSAVRDQLIQLNRSKFLCEEGRSHLERMMRTIPVSYDDDRTMKKQDEFDRILSVHIECCETCKEMQTQREELRKKLERI